MIFLHPSIHPPSLLCCLVQTDCYLQLDVTIYLDIKKGLARLNLELCNYYYCSKTCLMVVNLLAEADLKYHPALEAPVARFVPCSSSSHFSLPVI